MSFNFENLSVYQKAINLADEIYLLTKLWPKEYLYDLTSQLRRSVLSIALNIAEGQSRSKRDNRRFLDISRGSCFEAAAIIDLALKQKLLSQPNYDKIYSQLTEISRMITGLKSSLK